MKLYHATTEKKALRRVCLDDSNYKVKGGRHEVRMRV
jgi:hypothetical protein